MKDTFRDLLVEKDKANIIITGLSYDLGCSCGKGSAEAPEVIFELSKFLPPFTKDGLSIKELGLFNNGIHKIKKLSDITPIAKNTFKTDKFNIFIGGDHSVSIKTEIEFVNKCKEQNLNPVIIHVDAHPDFCDIYDGSKESHACTNYRLMEAGVEKFFLIGIRGFEEQEVELFKKNKNIKVFTSQICKETNPVTLANNIIKNIAKDEAIYLSFDIDALDPAYAPGTGTPESFGLTPDYLLEVFKTLFKSLNIKAFDIVEVSPKLDVNNITSWAALKILYEVFYFLIKK